VLLGPILTTFACAGLWCWPREGEAVSPGECSLAAWIGSGDLSGACTSVVKIKGSLRDGDHHRR
jgi:hypothetical protein